MLLGLSILLAAAVACAAPEDAFVLIVHPDNSVTTISRKEAELMFLSKKRNWPDGTSVAVIINENRRIYSAFSHTVLRRSPRQFLLFRKKMLFRGQGMPPPTAQTDRKVIEFVAVHAGGLGCISPESLTPEVKVVSISQQGIR